MSMFGGEGGKRRKGSGDGAPPPPSDIATPLAEEARNELRVAQGTARAGGEMLYDTIDTKQADVDFARAFVVALEQGTELVRET